MNLAYKFVWLIVAGAAGTLVRYGLNTLVQDLIGKSLPWGTLVVNVSGSLAFGIVWSLGERMAIGADLRMILLIGFMGAFTTFSTFMFETGQLLRDGEWLWAGANLLAQNLIGIIALLAGLAIGKAI